METDYQNKSKHQFKTSASREIESWANLAEYIKTSQSVARQIGQLSGNVTEDRMLLTKIMELSKERFKFMTQNNYDRKVFLERQQRKARYMSGLLRGIDVTTYLRNIGLGTSSMSDADHIKKQYAGRMALLREVMETRQAERSNKTMALPLEHFPDMGNEPNPEACRLLGEVLDTLKLPNIHEKRNDMSVNSIIDLCFNDKQSDEGDHKTEVEVESPLMKSRTKLLKMRPLADPRYFKLEKSLCEPHLPRDGYRPVLAIVRKIDTLHRPHKRTEITFQPSAGKRLNPRIRAYMEERGVLLRAKSANVG